MSSKLPKVSEKKNRHNYLRKMQKPLPVDKKNILF